MTQLIGCMHSAQDWYIKGDGSFGCDECDESRVTTTEANSRAILKVFQSTPEELGKAAVEGVRRERVDLMFKVEDHGCWFTGINKEKDLTIGAKFDGCLHVTRYMNGDTAELRVDPDNADYMHVCSPEDLIEQVFQVIQKGITLEKCSDYYLDPVEVVQRLINRLPAAAREKLKL